MGIPKTQEEEEPLAAEMVVNVNEFEAIAKSKLPKMVFDFYAAGAEDQRTLYLNKAAFSTIRLRPRVLIDVTDIEMSTTVLGIKIPMPIMIAPTGLHKMAHPQGELATAKAAASVGTIMVVSSSASCSIEEVAQAGNGPKFFQLYVYNDRKVSEDLVCRAERAGYRAVVLTGDTPRLGRRESDIKNRFILPPQVAMTNLAGLKATPLDKSKGSAMEAFASNVMDRSLSWKDIRWLQSITKLPIILKGVLTGEDASLAVQAGVSGIIVSNHGARQLDYTYPTILALQEVVQAVQGRIPVFLDGGIRRGTDIFKALAFGASAVLIGRPVVFSLAADGEEGVKKVLKMLGDELELTMALAGCCTLENITRDRVQVEYRLGSRL